MAEIIRTEPDNQTHEPMEKYSKFQIKGWSNFDPAGKTLAEISNGIERGDAFLTLVEVVKVEDDVTAIGDEEARECFENMLAAKRLLANVDELPSRLADELRVALKTEEETVTHLKFGSEQVFCKLPAPGLYGWTIEHTMNQPTDLQQPELSAEILAESHARFDQALAEWFARRRRSWSGTATELIAAIRLEGGDELWPFSARSLYDHLKSHKPALCSLGVEVLPDPRFPRMLSLRPCEAVNPGAESPSDTPAKNHNVDLLKDPHPPGDDQTAIPVISEAVSPAETRVPGPALDIAETIPVERISAETHVGTNDSASRRAFENTAEALFVIVAMRDRIAGQNLDLKSTMDLVASRTQEVAGCGGVVVGLLQQDALVYPARVGIAVTMVRLPSQANLFRSCMRQGTVRLLPDAQKDPAVGASCRREDVRSLIIAPISHNRKIAGAIELLFKETRSFSNGDVMTLELIADLIGERMAGVAKQASSNGADPGRALEPSISAGSNLQPAIAASVSRARRWTTLP